MEQYARRDRCRFAPLFPGFPMITLANYVLNPHQFMIVKAKTLIAEIY